MFFFLDPGREMRRIGEDACKLCHSQGLPDGLAATKLEGVYWIGYPASLHYTAISSNRTLAFSFQGV